MRYVLPEKFYFWVGCLIEHFNGEWPLINASSADFADIDFLYSHNTQNAGYIILTIAHDAEISVDISFSF